MGSDLYRHIQQVVPPQSSILYTIRVVDSRIEGFFFLDSLGALGLERG